jgi:hypothetical protein
MTSARRSRTLISGTQAGVASTTVRLVPRLPFPGMVVVTGDPANSAIGVIRPGAG